MPQFLQMLYSTIRHFFVQIPDLDAYIQNRVPFTRYDLDGVTIKLAESVDFQRLAATVDKFQDESRIAERTSRGDLCVVAYKHGALAHARWVAIKPLPSWDELTIHLDPDEAYTYDGYTLPAFRRQGMSGEARVFLIRYLIKQGFRCAYSDTRVDNVNTEQARIKWIREGRARILGVISVTKRLGQTRCTFTAETVEARSLIARLFYIPQADIPISSS